MDTLIRLAFLPFLVAAGITLARVLISAELALFLHPWIAGSVSFDNFSVVAAAASAAEDALIGRSAGLSAGVAIAICRSSRAPVALTANLAAAFVVIRSIMILLQTFNFQSAAQLARWSSIVCVAGLFGLVACPDARWLAIILTKPVLF